MNVSTGFKIFTVVISFLLVVSTVSSAPTYEENESNLRDILEMLLHKDNTNTEERVGFHQVARKASRSPQLRLRFGKRPDGGFPVSAYVAGLNEMEN